MTQGDRVWRERGLRSAVLAGDARAWQAWYDESFPGLYAYASWRCAGLRDLADEVVQETWLIAVRRIRSFDPDQASFSAWLRGIAANVLRNWYRRRKITHSLNGQHLATRSAPANQPEIERSERIAHTLASLPQRYEAILRAKYLDQQSVAQIAEAWQESATAIESLLTRARQAFRDVYQQLE
jgi:RNA polymerase sigma-70 factor (ECF subfamily)